MTHTLTLFAATPSEVADAAAVLKKEFGSTLTFDSFSDQKPTPSTTFQKALGGTSYAMTAAFLDSGEQMTSAVRDATLKMQASLEEAYFVVERSAGDQALAGKRIDMRFMLT